MQALLTLALPVCITQLNEKPTIDRKQRSPWIIVKLYVMVNISDVTGLFDFPGLKGLCWEVGYGLTRDPRMVYLAELFEELKILETVPNFINDKWTARYTVSGASDVDVKLYPIEIFKQLHLPILFLNAISLPAMTQAPAYSWANYHLATTCHYSI